MAVERTRPTPMQRRILSAMERHDGLAAFNGEGSRRHGYGEIKGKYGGIIIRAYGIPEWFLRGRGWIELAERNVPGTWFRITDAGRSALTGGRVGQ